MSQGPTTTRGASFNYDDLSSSPDPLAFDDDNIAGNLTSASARSPTKKRNQRRVSKAPAAPGNIPSSPFRAVAEQNLSPWKIRVTIEAEEEGEEGSNMETTTTAGRRVTRTMQIPLRQESPASDREVRPVRGRRPRSQESPSKTKRSGTPVRSPRKGAGARKQRQSVTDLNVRPLGDDADEDDWLRRKKSPRKKKTTTRARKSISGSEAATQTPSGNPEFEIHAESNESATHQGQANTDSVSPELRDIDLNKVSVRPRALSTKSTADGENHDPQNSGDQLDVPTMGKAKGLNLRRVSVNSAKSYPTPSPTSSYRGDSDGIGGNPVDDDEAISHDQDPHNEGFDTILESEGFTMIDLDTLPSAKQYGFSSPAAVEGNHQSNGAPESSTAAANASNQELEQHPSQPEEAISYPALNADESDLSSTVPSSPPPAAAAHVQEKSILRVQSDAARKVTPQPYSSPKLPSPPRQDGRGGVSHHRNRGSVSALAAGIALQGVVTPKHEHKHSDSASVVTVQEKQIGLLSREHQQKNESGLFQGFDCGTQRELRAGLRFGEELARRQSQFHSPAASGPETETASSTHVSKQEERHKIVGLGISKSEYSSHTNNGNPSHNQATATQVWRGENLVQRTPPVHAVPAAKPTETEQSQAQSPPRTPQNQESSYIDPPRYPDTQDREREREYQLERDAIIREIENASASQVIVIDSDSDEEEDGANAQRSGSDANVPLDENENAYQEDDDDEDIWLAEAKHSSSPGPEADLQSQATARPSENKFVVASKQNEDKESRQAKEVVRRPRRSLIPSSWKRGDDIENPHENNNSTFLSTATEDMSGLLFYKGGENNGRFGAGEIKRLQQQRQRRGSGKFDIDLMAGTPKKEAHAVVKEPRFRSDRRHVDVAAQIDRTDESQSSESDGSEAGQHVGDEETLDEVGVDSETQPEAEEEAEAEAEEEEPSSSVSLVSSPSAAPLVKKISVIFNDSSLSVSPGGDNDGNGKSNSLQQRQRQRPSSSQRVDSQSLSPPDKNTTTSTNTYSYPSPQRPATPRSALKGSRQSFAAECREREAGNHTPTLVPSRRVVFSERSRGVDVDGLESSFSMKSSSSRSDGSGVVFEAEEQHSESQLLSFVSTSSGNSTTAGELDGQLNGELQVQVQMQGEAQAPLQTQNGRGSLDNDNLHYLDDMRRKKSESQRVSAAASVSESDELKSASRSKKGWTSWLWKGKEHDPASERATATATATATGTLQSGRTAGFGIARHDERAHYANENEDDDGEDDENDESQDSRSESSGWQKTKSSIASSSLSSTTTLKQHAHANASNASNASKRAPAAETRTTEATTKSRQSKIQSQPQSRQLDQTKYEYQSQPHSYSQSHRQHQHQHQREREREHQHDHQYQRQNQHQPRRPDVEEVINNTSTTTRSTSRGSGANLNLPSYLLPPSYPSDPHRSPSTPLSLSGEFTNSHFRTLHIIYRKSLRPKFHAPAVQDIRPEIMALLGTEMEVDETDYLPNGGASTSVLSERSTLDEVFVWKIGEVECAVLERFMQECEFSQGVGIWSRNSSRSRKSTRLGDNNEDKVEWGWSVDQLATWLCRIVVGEVVRDEERKAREKARART
ncbi:hypothetical protein ABEF95_017281 [Exophiala dermatitidis]